MRFKSSKNELDSCDSWLITGLLGGLLKHSILLRKKNNQGRLEHFYEAGNKVKTKENKTAGNYETVGNFQLIQLATSYTNLKQL